MKKRATVVPFTPRQATPAASRVCSTACRRGNPYRGYVCHCTACAGKAHGAVTITLDTLEEWIDRKLMDGGMGQAEHARWLTILQTVMAHNHRRHRQRRA